MSKYVTIWVHGHVLRLASIQRQTLKFMPKGKKSTIWTLVQELRKNSCTVCAPNRILLCTLSLFFFPRVHQGHMHIIFTLLTKQGSYAAQPRLLLLFTEDKYSPWEWKENWGGIASNSKSFSLIFCEITAWEKRATLERLFAYVHLWFPTSQLLVAHCFGFRVSTFVRIEQRSNKPM